MSNHKIDIIVPWVDGGDIKWLEEKNKYDMSGEKNSGNSPVRYRDWGLMKYFFRGIEKNMPWVNKLYFVTWGHLPDFLKTDNPKLCIIKHSDYIPEEYLPTFNSSVIELNYHRIQELSENFILFNDDFYIVDELSENAFFRNDVPCDTLKATTLVNYDLSKYTLHRTFNNMGVINKHFSQKKKPIDKWVNPAYGFKNSARNLVKFFNENYSGFYDHHFAVPYRKSLFEKVWEIEGENLDKSCRNKFRSPLELSIWLMRYWQLASGEFYPVDVTKNGVYHEFWEKGKNVDEICDSIRNKEKPMIIVNDTLEDATEETFDMCREKITAALDSVLPDKCSFEK